MALRPSPFDTHGRLHTPISVGRALSLVRAFSEGRRIATPGSVDQWATVFYRVLAYRYPALSRAELQELNFGSELLGLEVDAKAAYAGDERAAKDAAARMRRFLEACLGWRKTPTRLRQPGRFAPLSFHPVMQAARAGGASKEQVGIIALMGIACHVLRHSDAPASYPCAEDMERALLGLGYRKKSLSALCTGYRAARLCVLKGAPEMVIADMPNRKNDARSAEHTLPPAVFAEKFPRIAKEVDYFVKVSDGQGPEQSKGRRSPSTRNAVVFAMRRICGVYEHYRSVSPEMANAPEPATMRTRDFIGCDVRVETTVMRGPDEEETIEIGVPIIEHLYHLDAEVARRRSSRFSHATEGFTDTQSLQLTYLWSVIKDSGRSDTDLEVRYRLITKRINDNLIPAEFRQGSELDKRLILRMITAPLVQVIGLPWFLRYVVKPAEFAWRAAAERAKECGHDPERHVGVRQLRDEFDHLLICYAATALALDDGLRPKNYANGRCGPAGSKPTANFELERRDGKLIVHTNWWHDLSDPSGIKNKRRKRTTPQKSRMHRLLRPGAVDHNALWTMIEPCGLRERRLRALGLLHPNEPYDPLRECRFPLFVSHLPSPSGWKDRTPGSYARGTLSTYVGETLYRIARECLGHDLPPWEQRGDEWNGLFGGHILRALIATYQYAVRDNIREAMYRTMDNEHRVKTDYSAECEEMADQMKLVANQRQWFHPSTYDAWMDRILGGEEFCPLDDPTLPLPPTLAAIINRGPPVLPVPLMRQARPEQARQMREGGGEQLRRGQRPARLRGARATL